MIIEQAIGTPTGRPAGVRYLQQVIEEVRASGFVAASLQCSGQHDAVVAPASTA